MRIAITGGTGLVGQALQARLTSRGDEVAAITRSPQTPSDIGWSPTSGELDADALAGFDAVVHLAGENIADGRWTEAKRRRIRDSRVNSTTLLANKLAALPSPPATLISASAIGYYGDRGDEELTESSPPGEGFLPETCIAWEQAANPARAAGMRVVHGRIGLVLTPQGGALQKMLTPFKLGMGGIAGSGSQYWSWIGLDDLADAFIYLLDHPEADGQTLDGAFNLTAPEPVTNREFTRVLAKQLGRPAFLPLPTFAIKTLLGEMGEELLLTSARIFPTRIQHAGFAFRHPTLADCLQSLL